ncbi:MAG: efflux RND transporter periplasmic adaptor subunit, partial [Solirubrobacterales bacterium]
MKWFFLAGATLLAAGLGVAGGYWLSERGTFSALVDRPPAVEAHSVHDQNEDAGDRTGDRSVLYYRDPMGGSDTSPVPKKDAMGMDYIPVFGDEAAEPTAGSPPVHQHGEPSASSQVADGPEADRKPLYYRNPMGLPDTSPVPKKDPMGMDYIPVFADDVEAAAQGFVKIPPERVQMIGVRSEAVSRRNLVRPIRAVGSVQFDERNTFVVSTRFEGWIERLVVNTTGQKVRRGEPLMEVYSPDLVLAQQEYALLRRSIQESGGGEAGAASRWLLEGAEQRLRYLDFPPAALQRLRAGSPPRPSITIPSPVSGTVIDKPSIQGMRFMPGDPLYRIVDMSTVWLIADVFEQDLAGVRVGQEATITVKAYPGRSFAGLVAFIYPVVDEQTRTARVRIEVPNPDDLLKADMYATVEIASPVGARDALTIPESAVID